MIGEGHAGQTDAHDLRQRHAFRQRLPYKVQGDEGGVVQRSVPLPGHTGRERQLIGIIAEFLHERLIVIDRHGPVGR